MSQRRRTGNRSVPFSEVREQDTEGRNKGKGRHKKRHRKRLFKGLLLVVVIVLLGYIYFERQTYENIQEVKDYSRESSDNYSYREFADGIIRYSRDGVVYLNEKNEEIWNQPGQIQNPIISVNKDAFAIADNGGDSIMVFTEAGLKGEVTTTLPIEKIAVSNQGIVAAILKNEDSPKIATYDTAGNLLVEHQATMLGTGYPMAIALSGDASMMAVSYLFIQDTELISKVVYYNFGTVGQSKTDNQVALDTYKNSIVPSIFFVNNETSVAVSDVEFIIYKGSQIPEAIKKVQLDKEIKSMFHSERYIGFVLENDGGSGYELRIYNMRGNQTASVNFKGEYGNVKISGNQVIMSEGSRACIFTTKGFKKFQGDLEMDVAEIIPLSGMNTYLLMNTNIMKKIRLIK
ncbi:MAG: hypothetical protein HFH53_06710 [Hespellia sp.]|jgi:hypothetical protein|nr:hypothetical protein [Hespellia sp.]